MTNNPERNSPPIISTDLVLLDAAGGSTKEAVIARLAALVADTGRAGDGAALMQAALAREAQSATGLPGGIAIPHCRTATVRQPSIAFARLRPPVDFGAGPADLVLLIAAPEAAGAEHLKLLSSLTGALVRPDFVQSLRDAPTAADVVTIVGGVLDQAAAGVDTAAPVDAGPTNALPTNALPTNALPTNAVPTNAVPANAVRKIGSLVAWRSRPAPPVSPIPTWPPTR